MRAHAPARKDKAIFKRTAAHTQKVNLGKIIFRGGIRF